MSTTPIADELPKGIDDLIRTWNSVALKASDRHAAACDHYERLDSGLGIASTALAAIVGSTIFVSLQLTTSLVVKIAAGVVGIAAAVLFGIQTTAKFGARSERHRQASRRYGALVREVEELRALPPAHVDLISKVDALRKDFDDAGSMAPDVPPRIWYQATAGRVSSGEAGEKEAPPREP